MANLELENSTLTSGLTPLVGKTEIRAGERSRDRGGS